MAKLIGIVAKNKNGVIGNGGALPWEKDSEDMLWFKSHTNEEIVVMGRKTWESIGCNPLKNRFNIILTKDARHLNETLSLSKKVLFCRDLKDLKVFFNLAKIETAFIIGGAQIYQAFAPFIEQWLVTEINDTSTGDTFFNESWLAGFTQVNQKIGYKGNKYTTYEKSL